MAWKTNPNVEDMYRDYLDGMSLSQVAKKWGCTRQSVFCVFKTRKFELRAKILKETVEFNGETYTENNNGYMRKTDGNRELLHREVWRFYRGEIPAGYDIHHIDNNKKNNSIDNLECLSKADHTRFHSPHNNQYCRGRTRAELDEKRAKKKKLSE